MGACGDLEARTNSVIVTLNPILYVKVNGCVGVCVFFLGGRDSYIVKQSLSKINPTSTTSSTSSATNAALS